MKQILVHVPQASFFKEFTDLFNSDIMINLTDIKLPSFSKPLTLTYTMTIANVKMGESSFSQTNQ